MVILPRLMNNAPLGEMVGTAHHPSEAGPRAVWYTCPLTSASLDEGTSATALDFPSTSAVSPVILLFLARSPCSATPSMRFLSTDKRFMLHASFPHSVALTQLRFALLTVTSSQRDLRPQACAHAGRTIKKPFRPLI